MEYFKYIKDLLNEAGAGDVQIYGGGGGVIIHDEKRELENYGIAQIFHPDDGRRLGLEGMIKMIIDGSNFDLLEASRGKLKGPHDLKLRAEIPHRMLGLALSAIEKGEKPNAEILTRLRDLNPQVVHR